MKKVIVVGGGIAGLSAGIYAAGCGFETTILESHAIAGGNCTSWRRGDYLFEGGMHWLTGSSKENPIYKVWRHLGALDDSVSVICPETFAEYDHNGVAIKLFRNADKLEKHLLSIAPEDSKPIRRLCGDIHRFGNLTMPLGHVKGLKATQKAPSGLAALKLLPMLPHLAALGKINCEEYARRFSHEGIQSALRACMIDEYYATALVMTLASMSAGDGGFPEGGSLPFVERMTKRFASLGGTIQYKAVVDRVLVENGRAVGVSLGGKRLDADAVIVTVDTMTAEKLFDCPPEAGWLRTMRSEAGPVVTSFVSLGVDADLSDLPHVMNWKPVAPLTAGGLTYPFLEANVYAGRGFAPAGKTAVTMPLAGDSYDFWRRTREDGRYTAEKQALLERVSDAFTAHVPRAKNRIEVSDLATPLTYERYCGTWRGSYMTLVPKKAAMRSHSGVPDNIRFCYFAGQRLMPPGGLPVAATTGRTAVQYLCRDTDTVFVCEQDA